VPALARGVLASELARVRALGPARARGVPASGLALAQGPVHGPEPEPVPAQALARARGVPASGLELELAGALALALALAAPVERPLYRTPRSSQLTSREAKPSCA